MGIKIEIEIERWCYNTYKNPEIRKLNYSLKTYAYTIKR